MEIIIPIKLTLPFHMGSVNCYLVRNGSKCLLIDTGSSNARKELEKALADIGCKPSDLRLIILTHGDFDHSGNAAHLSHRFGTKLAMHPSDAGIVSKGDMFFNRKQPNWLVRKLMPLFIGFGKQDKFIPAVLLNDGDDLLDFGFKAKVISIPGHSLGSIALLMDTGELLCGDLFENQKGPKLNSIMDDPLAAASSLEKLRSLNIKMVYPGHGEPFLYEQLSNPTSN